MSGIFRSLYREEAAAWKKHYRKYFKYAARALGLGFVAGFLFFVLWPAQEQRALAFVVKAYRDIPLDAGPALMAKKIFFHNVLGSAIAVATGVVPFLFLPILDPVLNGIVFGLLVSIGQHHGLNVPKLFLTQILPHGVFEIPAILYTTSLGLYLSAELGRRVKRAWQKRRPRKGTLTGKCTLSDPRPERAELQATLAAAGAAVPEGTPDGDLPGGTGTAGPLTESVAFPAPAGGPAPASPCQAGLLRDLVRSFVLVVLPLLLVAAIIEAFVTPHLR
jgi:uncharacterized membrane protein SpoIIM required for sporulation